MITFSHKGEIVKLIQKKSFGHHTEKVSFYIKNNHPFFIFRETFTELSISGPYKDAQERIYIYNNELIKVLSKEKTSHRIKIDLSNVANKDITHTITDKKTYTKKFIKQYQKSLAHTTKPLEIAEGYWVSIDDPQASVHLKGNTWTFIYKSKTVNSETEYNIAYDFDGKYTNFSLTNNRTTLSYSIFKMSEDYLEVIYLPRGNSLRYKRKH